MRPESRFRNAGFTLVELTVVVVISTIVLLAVYQTLITQEQSYRYQSAAIDTQGSTRVGLQVLVSEMRGLSASAGADVPDLGGSDLLVATSDSVRIRAFRKIGIACAIDTLLGGVTLWAPGGTFRTSTPVDTLLLFLEGDTVTDDDDRWVADQLILGTTNSAAVSGCRTEWPDYPVQHIMVSPLLTPSMARGALIRSYSELTYGAYPYDGQWVLGRREGDDSVVPLVGPLLSPEEGGLVFRFFDDLGNELNPGATQSTLARVARVEITVRALSRGGPNNENYVDSLSTNVFLRGN